MKKITYKILLLSIAALVTSSCYKEETPEAIWQYPGLDPEIPNGPSNAQQMCYALYIKYDLHVYYNISADYVTNVIRSDTGGAFFASYASANNSAAFPFQAADETSGERFLTLLTGFCALLPDHLVSSTYRRHVLVKINPGLTLIQDEEGNPYFSCAVLDNYNNGVIMYGYLTNNDDTNNTLFSNIEGWKWNLCYQFFRGTVYNYLKVGNSVLPSDFGRTSFGLYTATNTSGANVFYTSSTRIYNREIAKGCGFVHPFGGINSSNTDPYADWATYVAWILSTPYAERSADIEDYPRIRAKYGIVLDYYKNTYNMDLEAISVKYCALTL